jgi:hypothetical protein
VLGLHITVGNDGGTLDNGQVYPTLTLEGSIDGSSAVSMTLALKIFRVFDILHVYPSFLSGTTLPPLGPLQIQLNSHGVCSRQCADCFEYRIRCRLILPHFSREGTKVVEKTLDSLPSELLLIIAVYLEPRDLLRLARCSRSLQRLSLEEVFWSEVLALFKKSLFVIQKVNDAATSRDKVKHAFQQRNQHRTFRPMHSLEARFPGLGQPFTYPDFGSNRLFLPGEIPGLGLEAGHRDMRLGPGFGLRQPGRGAGHLLNSANDVWRWA